MDSESTDSAVERMVRTIGEQIGSDDNKMPEVLSAYTHTVSSFLVDRAKANGQNASHRDFALSAKLNEQALNPRQRVLTPILPFFVSEAVPGNAPRLRIPQTLEDRTNKYDLYQNGASVTLHSSIPVNEEAVAAVASATQQLSTRLREGYNSLRNSLGPHDLTKLADKAAPRIFIPSYFALHNEPLVIIDVDASALKATNDNFGHMNGNQVIQRVARALMQQRIDGSDGYFAVHDGGDEFKLLYELHSMPPETMMENIQKAVSETPLELVTPSASTINYRMIPAVSIGHGIIRSPHEVREAYQRAEEERQSNKSEVNKKFMADNPGFYMGSGNRLDFKG